MGVLPRMKHRVKVAMSFKMFRLASLVANGVGSECVGTLGHLFANVMSGNWEGKNNQDLSNKVNN